MDSIAGELAAFNRTIVELKRDIREVNFSCVEAFNRTIVELKQDPAIHETTDGIPLLIEPLWN